MSTETEKRMRRREVEIFLGPMACSCAGMPSPAKMEKVSRALNLERALQKDYEGVFSVKTWNLGADEEYEEGINVLGAYLDDAGEAELAEHPVFAVRDVTPSVAVDGKLVWIGDCPEAAGYLERFGTAARSKPS